MAAPITPPLPRLFLLRPAGRHLPAPHLHNRQHASIRQPNTRFYASSSSSSASSSSSSSRSTPQKPLVLEKPPKFNPPSHPQRLRNKAKTYSYGPAASPAELRTRATKQYPHTFPPPDSFMHWFLTNRTIHVWISLTVLSSLAAGVMVADFARTTPFRDLLPARSEWWARPAESLGRAWDVQRMHAARKTEEAGEKRRKAQEEVRRRKAYRVAHGLEAAGEGLQLGEGELRRFTGDVAEAEGAVGEGRQVDAKALGAGGEGGQYTDLEGRSRRPIKKWFGIWE